MLKGINYFWVSIQMKPETSLLAKVATTMPNAQINNKPIDITWKGKVDERHVGIGVRQAGDDGSAAFRIPGLVTTNNLESTIFAIIAAWTCKRKSISE